MKSRGVIISILSILLAVEFAFGEEQVQLKSPSDRTSYALGLSIGNDFKEKSMDVDADIFMQGLKDGYSGGKRMLSDEELRETITSFTREMAIKQALAMKQLGDANRRDGELFLAENKTKEGVKTLPDGLQYKVISEGSGKTPKPTDVVTVNYRGILISGIEFDNSYSRGQPATFPVNGVIPGWTEALRLMKEGAKWQLFIPSNLAYGESPVGKVIGPNSTLIFDVELISIQEDAKK